MFRALSLSLLLCLMVTGANAQSKPAQSKSTPATAPATVSQAKPAEASPIKPAGKSESKAGDTSRGEVEIRAYG